MLDGGKLASLWAHQGWEKYKIKAERKDLSPDTLTLISGSVSFYV